MAKECCPDPKSLGRAPLESGEPEACCELHPPTRCGPARCPQCGVLGKPVQKITLVTLLKPERRSEIPEGNEFCFCRTAVCDVVYFLPDHPLFHKNDLLIRVGLKEPNDSTVPVCYCFAWTPEKIQAEIKETGKSTVGDQIKAQVKKGNCYCEVTNPQGSCCLGNVSKVVKEALSSRK